MTRHGQANPNASPKRAALIRGRDHGYKGQPRGQRQNMAKIEISPAIPETRQAHNNQSIAHVR
jgi:hypothetical protein